MFDIIFNVLTEQNSKTVDKNNAENPESMKTHYSAEQHYFNKSSCSKSGYLSAQ